MLSTQEIIWWRAAAIGRAGLPIREVERFTALTTYVKAAYHRGEERRERADAAGASFFSDLIRHVSRWRMPINVRAMTFQVIERP